MSLAFHPIMHREMFEAFILGLPGATLVRQWRDDSVGKVGGKVFALLDKDPGEIWFKASPMAYELLCELEGVRPAPYFARAGWVAVSASSPLSEDEMKAYVREAHRLVAARLTRKVRAELGLD
ncbi:MmcQ/YjbR family DNA-binding protein [Devosia submarina]|uniref:MmcQ/YjbR family DNA-binding protein n=1 Tax=Devosia submarina TaxID=1173082 RepID=UPI001FE33F6A|nr:MmcQ/YjbR family DNA-binding protein [Devosia submarina]